MAKVPVARSIAHAYEFLFGRFFQIIGTAWLPAVLYGVGCYAVLSNAPAWLNLGDPVSIGRSAGIVLACLLGETLVRAVIAISLTQEALGIRKDLTLAHLVVGPRELRLFFGLLLYFVVFVVLYALVLAISFGLLFAARKYGAGLAPNLALRGAPAAVVAAVAIIVVVVLWFWLSMLRLLFLLAPIASVEHRLQLVRAWKLTRGSTLRTFVVLVAVFLPVMVAAWIASRFALHVGPVAEAQPHARPAEILGHVLQFYGANAAVLALAAGAFAVLNGALLAGASAAAYRSVTNHEEPEPEDDAALVAPLLVADEPYRGEDGHNVHDPVAMPVEQHANGPHGDHAHADDDQLEPAHDVHGGGQDAEHAGGLPEHHSAHDHAGHADDGNGHATLAPEDVAGRPEEHGHGDHPHETHGDGEHAHAEHGGGHGDSGSVHHAAPPGGALDPVGLESEPEARAA